jgi:hypothetical protein
LISLFSSLIILHNQFDYFRAQGDYFWDLNRNYPFEYAWCSSYTPQMNSQPHSAFKNCTSAVSPATLAGRAYVTKDPAGYALQTLEASLLEHNQGRKLFFSAPELAILELAPQIGKLPREKERRAVLLNLMKHVQTNDEYRKYIATKLPYLISFISLRERMRLLSHVLTWPKSERRASAAMAYAIVRSIKNKEEMLEMITEKRGRQLLRLRHKELREIVAKVVFMRHFSQLSIPLGLSRAVAGRVVSEPRKARQLVRARLHALYDSVKEHLRAVESHRQLARTRSAKEFTRSLKDALQMLAPHVSRYSRFPQRSLSRFDGAKLASLVSLKVRSELKYGVWFARSRSSKDKPASNWTESDIKSVLPALKEIGEGLRLMTPLLHRIERSSHRGEYGTRASNGVIQLTYQGRLDRSYSRQFGGQSYPLLIMVHEIGHAIQIGASPANVSYSKSTGLVSNPADPIFDFRAFCQLSGWRFITEHPWSLVLDGRAVKIADSLYPLYQPTSYAGRDAILVQMKDGGERYLLERHSHAKFGIRDYASYDPWEDWAEGFTEYVLAPERFLVFAPEKFLYFHVHFRRYDESSELIQNLHAQLARVCE